MRFELAPTEHPQAGLQRLGRALIDDAIGQIENPDVPPATALHEARKDMKKLRGLLRLLRRAAPDLYQAENRAFRDAAAHLAVMRDADAALATFDLVLRRAQPQSKQGADFAAEAHVAGAPPPREPLLFEAVEPAAIAGLRETLSGYREEAHAGIGDLDERLATFRGWMLEARERIPDWRLAAKQDTAHAFALLGPGLKKTYRRGRKAMQRAYAQPHADAFHDWRKRTKYLGYQLRLLQPGWPKLIKAQRRAVKALQGLLGEDHDLAVLTDLLAELRPQGPTADEPLAGELALNREMRRQSELLRRRARHLGEIVYAEQPKALGKRLGVYWTEAQRAA
jgi:CHAD domain-containing protein